jgi:Cys-rich repeat protein
MNKLPLALSLLLSATAFAACTDPDTGTASGRVIIDQPCASDADCPGGFECEIELEHGVTTSYCQSHGGDHDGGVVCPAGYELEVEHGVSYCKPHGGDDGSGSGSGGGQAGDTCASDADCGTGLECEIEEEHGETTSWCQPHGGN